MTEGFIKLHRKMTEWEWYDDTNTKIVFLHLLLTANFRPRRYHGIEIEPGQTIIGRSALAKRLGLSERQVRTALEHLKSTNEISIKTTNKFSVVTIENWAKYQMCIEVNDQQPTNNRPTTDQQPTTPKERKNVRKKENIIPPTVEMVREYCLERKNGIDADDFCNFYESKGWMVGKNKMKNWQSAIRTWEKSRKDKQPTKAEPPKYKHFEREKPFVPDISDEEARANARAIMDKLKGIG